MKKQDTYKRQIAIDSLTKIKQMQKVSRALYKLNVDIANLDTGIELIIRLVSALLAKSEEDAEMEKGYIDWWAFEFVKKEITINDVVHNVESPEDFVDFLLNN